MFPFIIVVDHLRPLSCITIFVTTQYTPSPECSNGPPRAFIEMRVHGHYVYHASYTKQGNVSTMPNPWEWENVHHRMDNGLHCLKVWLHVIGVVKMQLFQLIWVVPVFQVFVWCGHFRSIFEKCNNTCVLVVIGDHTIHWWSLGYYLY